MNRRGFFSSLLGGAVAAKAIVDPEFALWVPGKKRIFIPPARPKFFLTPELISREMLRSLMGIEHQIKLDLVSDLKFVCGETWPKIGDRITVRNPARYIGRIG